MARYRITNLSPGIVKLPPPLGRRLDKGQTLDFTTPAGSTEANINGKYSPLRAMVNTGLIRVTTIEDSTVDNNIEVATVSMLGSVTAAGEYRAVANTAARDAIPLGERAEGMLVRTNDTGQFWTLNAGLLAWTLLTFSGQPSQYRAVSDAASRDALPIGERFQGMLVRTNDTGLYWTLGADLTTWSAYQPSQYRAVGSVAVRDALPASVRVEGLLVRTNDTGAYWVLGGDLATWSPLTLSGPPAQYRAVANTTVRDAIPAPDRVEGMLVRTNDTGAFWTLGADLSTWSSYQPSQYRAVANTTARNAIPLSNRIEGMLVRTNDAGLYWVLGSDLVTWSALDIPAPPAQYMAVADYAARNAIPAPARTNGMMVRTNSTGEFWLLASDLVTWGLITFGSMPSASSLGQVLISVDGTSFTPHLPITTVDPVTGGWLVTDLGYMLVAG